MSVKFNSSQISAQLPSESSGNASPRDSLGLTVEWEGREKHKFGSWSHEPECRHLLLSSCVYLGKSPTFSEPQSVHLQMTTIIISALRGGREDWRVDNEWMCLANYSGAFEGLVFTVIIKYYLLNHHVSSACHQALSKAGSREDNGFTHMEGFIFQRVRFSQQVILLEKSIKSTCLSSKTTHYA